ncbi:MAG: glycerate kinase [Bacteroidia bacterium]|nr:glycerate kinase [Bacteroidia bacterium]
MYGKLVSGVAARSRARNKKLVAVSGVNTLSAEGLHRLGILSSWSLVDVTTHIEAIEQPAASLRRLVVQKLVPWLKTFR